MELYSLSNERGKDSWTDGPKIKGGIRGRSFRFQFSDTEWSSIQLEVVRACETVCKTVCVYAWMCVRLSASMCMSPLWVCVCVHE